MKDWLEQNPGGSKDVFEKYFKALTEDAKKVGNNSLCSIVQLILFLCYRDTRILLLLQFVQPEKSRGRGSRRSEWAWE
jgi:hypothetical protein